MTSWFPYPNDPHLPRRWVTRIVADPDDAAVAYVTFSGFRNEDRAAYVLKTVDGGTSWTDITGDLPRAPVNVLALAGAILLVGTDVGVFLSPDAGATWLRAGDGLPEAPVMDIRYHQPTNQLYASTFGRGKWKVQLPPSFAPRPAQIGRAHV